MRPGESKTGQALMCAFFLCVIGGSVMTGIGTFDWLHGAIEETQGTVEVQWVRSVSIAEGVVCISQLWVGPPPPAGEGSRGAGAVGTLVNVSTRGPCVPDTLGSVVDMCQPRHRPEAARLKLTGCGEGVAGTLALMVVGWFVLGLAVVVVCVVACFGHRV
jgi:hypothetical protein